MPIQDITLGHRPGQIHDLSRPAQLDLTSDPWWLEDGQASMILGLDVVTPGTFRPDRGRRSLGVSLPTTLTSVFGSPHVNLLAVAYRNLLTLPLDTGVVQFPWEGSQVALLSNYTSATGVVSGSGNPFLNYTDSAGDLAVFSNVGVLGFYPVLSQIDANNLRILPGLGDVTNPVVRILRDVPTVFRIPVGTGADQEIWLIMSPRLYVDEGPWPTTAKDATVFFDLDERQFAESSARVLRVETFGSTNDALVIDTAAGSHLSKLTLIYPQDGDARGIWVSDGKTVYRFQSGEYQRMLDLDDDAALGTEWQFCRISSRLLLLTNPRYAPRVLHLTDPPLPLNRVSDDSSLAGCLPPSRPRYDENPETDKGPDDQSWIMIEDGIPAGSTGLNEGGSYRLAVRAINEQDGLESSPVLVSSGQITSGQVTVGSTGINVMSTSGLGLSALPVNRRMQTAGPPITHRRWTHIEVFRTTDSASTFHREARIDLAKLAPDIFPNELLSSDATTGNLAEDGPRPEGVSVQLQDGLVPNLEALTESDLAVGPPPICRQAASLDRVTLCFGKADADSVDPTVYANDFFQTDYGYTTSGIYGRITAGTFNGYTFVEGDQFVVTFGGRRTLSPVPEGVYNIRSKVSDLIIELEQQPLNASLAGNTLRGYIRRPFTWPWPRILSDEDVWYSRTDKFAPESFPARVKEISAIGDTFRKAVNVGNYVAAIMDQGVHLFFLEGTTLQRDTVAVKGEGTPWKDSVISYGRQVFWAHPDGIRVMSVSDSEDDEGHRGNITAFDTTFRSWFREALEAGQVIDSGLDSLNGCIRWRRRFDDNTYQVLQYSFRRQLWTLLDDDSGFRYAEAPDANGVHRLYSVTPEGAIFKVNPQDNVFAHADSTCSGQLLIDPYNHTGVSLTAQPGEQFSPAMVGDIIRFYPSARSRVIRQASHGMLIFDSIDLSGDTTWEIAATRFRYRPAAFRGKIPNNVKKLFGLRVHLRPGLGAGKPVTVRSYGDFLPSPQDQRQVSVFEPSDKSSYDRGVGLDAEGEAIEIELESVQAHTDFRVEVLQARVVEENTSVLHGGVPDGG